MQTQTETAFSRPEQLAGILELSLAMLDRARAGDWDGLAAQEAERRQRVAECFREPAGATEAAQVAEAIRRILVVNTEITELTQAQRDTLGASLHAFGTARKAQKAYGQHG